MAEVAVVAAALEPSLTGLASSAHSREGQRWPDTLHLLRYHQPLPARTLCASMAEEALTLCASTAERKRLYPSAIPIPATEEVVVVVITDSFTAVVVKEEVVAEEEVVVGCITIAARVRTTALIKRFFLVHVRPASDRAHGDLFNNLNFMTLF